MNEKDYFETPSAELFNVPGGTIIKLIDGHMAFCEPGQPPYRIEVLGWPPQSVTKIPLPKTSLSCEAKPS